MAYYNLPSVHDPEWHRSSEPKRYQEPDWTIPCVSMGWEPYDEPMHRYSYESNQALFKPDFTLSEMTMSSLPDIPFTSTGHTGISTRFQPFRPPSPTESGRSSMVTPDTSDCGYMSWARLEPASHTPVSGYHDVMTSNAAGYARHDVECVALHDVQGYADAQPEKIAFHEDAQLPCAVSIQEGYQPIPVQRTYEPDMFSPVSVENFVLNDCSNTAPKVRQQRASTHRRPAFVHPTSTRVSKRSPVAKRLNTSTSTKRINQAFPCPFAQYGCASTFGSKNEWKRHTSTQHMHFGYWQCDQCPSVGQNPNTFNRKDLFIQHVRRMHLEKRSGALSSATKTNNRRPASTPERKDRSEDEYLQQISARCYHRLRSPPPRSGCPFCPLRFSSWDNRMEHVGRHLEAMRKENSGRGVKKEHLDPDWKCDEELEEWLLDEKLLVRKGRSLVLADNRRAE